MFKLIGIFFKLSLFAAIVLVLGQMVHWKGRTISDQIKTGLSQAERSTSIRSVKRKSQELIQDAKNAARTNLQETSSSSPKIKHESIPSSERKQLSALLDGSTDTGRD